METSGLLGCCWHGLGVTEADGGSVHTCVRASVTPNSHRLCVCATHRCRSNLCKHPACLSRLIFSYTPNNF